ncbi:hypothetical protein C8J57DRAFT_977766, partial [Mycena rebaudengoi]
IRLIPKANFQSREGRAQLVAHLLRQTAAFGMPYIPVGPPVAFKHEPGATSVSPAWRDTVWHVRTSVGWPYNATTGEVRRALSTTHAFVDELRALAPNSGAYLNEAELYETDHEVTYWGPNYARLLAVKRKCDPHGLLDCWKC